MCQTSRHIFRNHSAVHVALEDKIGSLINRTGRLRVRVLSIHSFDRRRVYQDQALDIECLMNRTGGRLVCTACSCIRVCHAGCWYIEHVVPVLSNQFSFCKCPPLGLIHHYQWCRCRYRRAQKRLKCNILRPLCW